MTTRTYGQHCGMARALDALGERWAMLIVRDLLIAPQRFTDLKRELAGIPSNILTARLKDLERQGIVERRVMPRPDGSVVYALTPDGQELEEVVLALGRWGSRRLGDPRDGEIVTASSMTMAMRTCFRPEEAAGLHVGLELRLGEIVIGITVDDGTIDAHPEALAAPDLVIVAGPSIKDIMTGAVTPERAVAEGHVVLDGDVSLWPQFARVFHIDARVTS